MGQLIILMGPTGAGKSVQGDLLAEKLKGVHLSSGELLRRDPKIAEMIADGKLAPASEVERIVSEALSAVPASQPVILDGFPRTMSNVRWLNENAASVGREVTAVVHIDLDLETSIKRLGLRDRADDSEAAIAEKWEEYKQKTQPVVDDYEEQGVLKRIDGRGDIPTVQKLLQEILA